MADAPQQYDVQYFDADRFSAMGDKPVLVVDARGWRPAGPRTQGVCIGVDRDGQLPAADTDSFDVLLTTAEHAPAPWVSVPQNHFDIHADQLAEAVCGWPFAATILCRTLRLSEHMPFADALDIESLAYSALLGGAEFRRWCTARGPAVMPNSGGNLVQVKREADIVTVTLNDPASRNAMTAGMRDALHVALANILDDPSTPSLQLSALGPCFSTGGALGEFGSATDLAQAHIVRTLRSCAGLLHAIGDRGQVLLHGACVGSGLEIPAAAARRIATSDAWFQLPELRMGLIPGAGGTASVARAIGRHRTAWMVLSGKRIRAGRALGWGLVHEVVA